MIGTFEKVLLWNGQLWMETMCAWWLIGALRHRLQARRLAPVPIRTDE